MIRVLVSGSLPGFPNCLLVVIVSEDLDDQTNHLDYEVKYLKKITTEFHRLPSLQFCGNGKSYAAYGYDYKGPVPFTYKLDTDTGTDNHQANDLADVTIPASGFFCIS